MNIGVAIVTYNSENDIAQCVESVIREGVQDIAIIDSASDDHTIQELALLGHPFQVLDTNRGFGYAANRAAKMLNTEYVLFLNPDSTLTIGAIDRLVRTILEQARVGIIGMLLCDPAGKSEDMAYGDEPTLFRMMLRHFYSKGTPHSLFAADWVSGGAFLIPKRLFEQLGGFDEDFFLYWEDVDLCRRTREAGYPVCMDPVAKVTHLRGGSNLDGAEKTSIYDQSADRYFKKHYSTTIWKIQRFLRRLYRS